MMTDEMAPRKQRKKVDGKLPFFVFIPWIKEKQYKIVYLFFLKNYVRDS